MRIYTITVFRAEPFGEAEVEPEETEPTEPATEPTEETTVPTIETTEATEPQPTQSVETTQKEPDMVLVAICGVISFLCGILIPMLLRKKKK